MKTPKDIGASVRARLLRLARERGEDFQLVLTRYANERFLYRLATSDHASKFVLKGAALFTLWTGEPHRATRDVDFLGFGDPSVEQIRSIFSEVMTAEVVNDGVSFDFAKTSVSPIREEQAYGGVRVAAVAHISSAVIRLQIDIGFGDAITPEVEVAAFPALLDFPAPTLRCYPRETVVAEKLEAMVVLGQANSRMKDFYDLAILSQIFTFEGDVLVRAIAATFARRQTPMRPGLPIALTSQFTDDQTKRTQWAAFLRKSAAPNKTSLRDAAATITRFVEQPIAAATSGAAFRMSWKPGGPWT
jgi:predicted nucleotidyltransferase component of viral defense system